MNALGFAQEGGPLAPKHIGRLVAQDLTSILPGHWKATADGIRSTAEGQTTEIDLQRGRASSTERGVWFFPRLVVRDGGLKDWLTVNSELIGLPVDDRIFNSLFVNFTATNEVFVSQTRTDPTATSYDDFCSLLLESVLPTRDLMRAPETLLDLPERWLRDVRGMLLWSVSVGRSDLCWPLIDRNVGANEVWRAAFARGLLQQAKGEPENRSNFFDSLGHLVGRIRERVELGAAPGWLDVN